MVSDSLRFKPLDTKDKLPQLQMKPFDALSGQYFTHNIPDTGYSINETYGIGGRKVSNS